MRWWSFREVDRPVISDHSSRDSIGSANRDLTDVLSELRYPAETQQRGIVLWKLFARKQLQIGIDRAWGEGTARQDTPALKVENACLHRSAARVPPSPIEVSPYTMVIAGENSGNEDAGSFIFLVEHNSQARPEHSM